MLDGRRQLSTGGTSRMTRERPVRFCEGLGVKFPGPTRRRPREGRLGKAGGGFHAQKCETPLRGAHVADETTRDVVA